MASHTATNIHQKKPQNNIPASSDRDVVSSRWLTSWKPYVWLPILGFLVFGRTIFFGFTGFDDDILILKDFHPANFLSAVYQAFTQPYFFIYYRPVVLLSFVLDEKIGHITPWIFHVSNVFYHLIVCLLLFRLLELVRIPRDVAFMATAIFTVHPLATQTIAWIPGRNDSLAAIFVLGSMIFFLISLESKKKIIFIAHLFFFLLALLTKETTIVFPLLCVLYAMIVLRMNIFSRDMIRFVSGWCAVFILWMVCRQGAELGFGLTNDRISFAAVFSNGRTFLEMFGKLFLPIGLSVYPTFHTINLLIGISGVLLGILFIFFFRRDETRSVAYALIWMGIFLVPGLSVTLVDGEHRFRYLECREYLSLVGVPFILATLLNLGVPWIIRNKRVFVFAIVIACCIASVTYSPDYADPMHHWESAVSSSPDAADAWYHYARTTLENDGDTARAELRYKEAIRLDPRNADYHNNLGIIYGSRGDIARAEQEFNEAINLNSLSPLPFNNLGYLYCLHNDFTRAELNLKAAIALDSTFAQPQIRMVELLYRQQRLDEAKIYATRLEMMGIPINPELRTQLHMPQSSPSP